jgi:hypothetical protein
MSLPLAPFGATPADDNFLPASLGLLGMPLSGGDDSPSPAGDPVDAYFECITTCSLEDGECVTQCVEILREQG